MSNGFGHGGGEGEGEGEGGGGEGEEEGTTWTNYENEPEEKLEADFIINIFKNATSNYKLNEDSNPQQVPFIYGINGTLTLRGKTTPYKAER